MQRGMSRSDIRVTVIKPYGVTGETLDTQREQLVSFVIAGRKFRHIFGIPPSDQSGRTDCY